MSSIVQSRDNNQGTSGLQQQLQRLPTFARELIAGGVAGGMAKTCVAPLERTKILFQTGKLPKSATVPETVISLWQKEGVHGLFKGNGASVARIVPYAAIHFSMYEYYRRMMLGSYEGHVNPGWDLLAGSAAGATAVLLTYPMDLVRAQLAYQTEAATTSVLSQAPKHCHPSIRSTISGVLKERGAVGLFRGITPTLLGILPYAGLKFYVYQSLKHTYRSWSQPQPVSPSNIATTNIASGNAAATATATAVPASASANTTELAHKATSGHSGKGRHPDRLPVPIMLLLGSISGLVGQTVTYPLDVVRRCMQVDGLKQASAAYSIAAGSVPRQAAVGLPCKQGTAAVTPASGSSPGFVASPASLARPTFVASPAPPAGPALVVGPASASHRVVAAPTTASTPASTPSSSLPTLQCRVPVKIKVGMFATGAAQAMRAQGPSSWQMCRDIVRQGGVKALYRGLSINYMKVIPSTAIGFTMYDALKAYLDLKNNL